MTQSACPSDTASVKTSARPPPRTSRSSVPSLTCTVATPSSDTSTASPDTRTSSPGHAATTRLGGTEGTGSAPIVTHGTGVALASSARRLGTVASSSGVTQSHTGWGTHTSPAPTRRGSGASGSATTGTGATAGR